MSYISLISSLFIVLMLCIDSFVISIAYGSNKVKIPFITTVVMAVIGSSFLFISMSFGNYIGEIISIDIFSNVVFIILFIMGFYKICESAFKTFVSSDKKIDFKISNVNFSLDIVCDKNIVKRGTILTIKEAVSLGIALSFDSLIVGVGISIMDVNCYLLSIFSFLSSVLFMNLGSFIGKKISMKSECEVGWLSGIMLMTMAISKIIKL